MVRALAERLLVAMGQKVTALERGEQALALLADGAKVSLLLTDVAMPELDGVSLARKARQRRPGIVIRFMSGYTHHERLQALRELSGAEVLAKPFRAAAFQNFVESALGQPDQT